MKTKMMLLLVVIYLLLPVVNAGNSVCLYIFYGKTCPHCGEERAFLQGLKTKYSQLEIHEFEVYYNKANRDLFNEIAKAYHITTSSGVPMTFIGEKAFIGFVEGNDEIYDSKTNAYVGYSGILEKTIEEYAGKGGVNCPSNVSTTVPPNQNEVVISVWILGVIFIVIVIMGLMYKFKIIRMEVR
ncbi:MAG: hypothetical protein QMD36_05520 [Candidatus Aenigmarchaeota archaeon]|nr:hypothetical protein [Candidatus Aenigmarchaeota archaeon]